MWLLRPLIDPAARISPCTHSRALERGLTNALAPAALSRDLLSSKRWHQMSSCFTYSRLCDSIPPRKATGADAEGSSKDLTGEKMRFMGRLMPDVCGAWGSGAHTQQRSKKLEKQSCQVRPHKNMRLYTHTCTHIQIYKYAHTHTLHIRRVCRFPSLGPPLQGDPVWGPVLRTAPHSPRVGVREEAGSEQGPHLAPAADRAEDNEVCKLPTEGLLAESPGQASVLLPGHVRGGGGHPASLDTPLLPSHSHCLSQDSDSLTAPPSGSFHRGL